MSLLSTRLSASLLSALHPKRRAAARPRRRSALLALPALLRASRLAALATATLQLGCAAEPAQTPPRAETGEAAPSILLITLDTTRADRLGASTPNLDRLAARGVVFDNAHTTAPTTLPAHTSILTGLLPAEHGIHENARYLDPSHGLLQERLRNLGYRTAAFVSGLPLDAQFGLARGFEHYDDDFEGAAERNAEETTRRAFAYLDGRRDGGQRGPLFLWLHYYDPHDPYSPPEPYRSRFAEDPYQGEIAYLDEHLGRAVAAFEQREAGRGSRIVVVGDHGEGLGDHGERLHGNLLYQGVMRVPLIVVDGSAPGRSQVAVSSRRIFDLVLDWAGGGSRRGTASAADLLAGGSAERPEPALGEAMKPYLQYGWQPQVMAVSGSTKAIRSGEIEIYDLASDPDEARNLAGRVELDPAQRRALRSYPLPSRRAHADGALDDATRRQLASLGYVDASVGRGPDGGEVRADAPSPRDMAHLFEDLDAGSALFVAGEYRTAISRFSRVLEQDPQNLMVAVRLAVAHSLLGDEERAEELFGIARRIDPGSIDTRHYEAMHHLRFQRPEAAEPLLESVLAAQPERLPALRALAAIREEQGRPAAAERLWERVADRDAGDPEALIRLGSLRMAAGDTAGAIEAFELARAIENEDFAQDLELGVLYLAMGSLEAARDALDRVPDDHPAHPMARFKRAQVSVLLDEPDQRQRIDAAVAVADETTRPLIARERLFREAGHGR